MELPAVPQAGGRPGAGSRGGTTGDSRTGRHGAGGATRPSRCTRGQSTVELACVLPIVVLCILLAVQAGLVMRDRLLVVHAARTAARAVIVDPVAASAVAALRRQGSPVDRAAVTIRGDPRPGGLVTVTVRMRPTPVPVVGRVVASMVLEEHLAVLVEGSG